MIRHSTLPKLAQCARYESAPGPAGPAAERGTRMDAAYRAMLLGKSVEIELAPDELDGVLWAVDTIRKIAGDHHIEANEDNLKVVTLGLEHVGTEDTRIETQQSSADLKSGTIRSYYEQAAAYGLGNMERTFTQKWTYFMLFCDQKEVVEYNFTYEKAEKVVTEVLAAVHNPSTKPTVSDYCGWCAKKDVCPARTVPVTETLAIVETPEISLEAMKSELVANPERLGKFLQAAAMFEDFVGEVKTAAKDQMATGVVVPGWKLQEEAGREHFDRIAIVRAAIAGKSGLDDLVANLGGKMTGSKFREWCAKMGVPVQEEQAVVGKKIVKLVVDKPKKARAAK
jgi:hypothetical protein